MHENDDNQNRKSEAGDLSAKEIAEQATNLSPDEIKRQILRGDETEGDADKRDVVGGTNRNETPQGREEAKPDSK